MTKVIMFVRTFEYWHPSKRYMAKFERLRRYRLPDYYADWFIENKYAFIWQTFADLPEAKA